MQEIPLIHKFLKTNYIGVISKKHNKVFGNIFVYSGKLLKQINKIFFFDAKLFSAIFLQSAVFGAILK
jgi:hypothetical protein